MKGKIRLGSVQFIWEFGCLVRFIRWKFVSVWMLWFAFKGKVVAHDNTSPLPVAFFIYALYTVYALNDLHHKACVRYGDMKAIMDTELDFQLGCTQT